MNIEDYYWKLAWDSFQMELFNYRKDVEEIHEWLEEQGIEIRKILEAGCGAAHYIEYFNQLEYDVTGVDIDDKVLAYAQGRLNSDEVELKRGDILSSPPDELRREFDLVLGKHLSFPLNSYEKFLDYAKEVLSEEDPGIFIFDYLVLDGGMPSDFQTSIDSTVINDFFLVRFNKMELDEKKRCYDWREEYLIKATDDDKEMRKENNRGLWFFTKEEEKKLLDNPDLFVELVKEERTGIKNLRGKSIFARFNI